MNTPNTRGKARFLFRLLAAGFAWYGAYTVVRTAADAATRRRDREQMHRLYFGHGDPFLYTEGAWWVARSDSGTIFGGNMN